MIWALLIVAALLSFANGANDNFKGVATLHGSKTASYRMALGWATITTLAGSLTAILLAGALIKTFSGKGLIDASLVGQPQFMLAVGGGAAATILLATRFGLPISTTHALIGALVGAGLVCSPTGVAFSTLMGTFFLPLLLSPLAAAILVLAVYPLIRQAAQAYGGKVFCLCLTERATATVGPELALPSPELSIGGQESCDPQAARLVAVRVFDGIHYLSAGAVGFARGLNDAPKIAALTVASTALAPTVGLIACGIAVGGLTLSRRVAKTISEDLTQMDPVQGLGGNLVTAALVLTASLHGMPVSTTHVSTGALFGIGVSGRQLQWRMAGTIGLAWLFTLPLAAAFAAGLAAII